MKKIFLVTVLFLFINPVFAIEWLNLKSASGNMFALDVDSITELNGYYFYNLKVYTNGLDDIVVTMQSKISSSFSTRIEHYKLSQYEKLEGNYKNISKNMTDRLEPAPYESSAYAAHKKVKEIMSTKNKPQITF